MKLSLLLAACLFLSSCDSRTPEQYAADVARYCAPIAVSQTPDGVTLWRVSNQCPKIGRWDVYFSTKGTHSSHEECYYVNKSRTCHEIHDEVPNEETK